MSSPGRISSPESYTHRRRSKRRRLSNGQEEGVQLIQTEEESRQVAPVIVDLTVDEDYGDVEFVGVRQSEAPAQIAAGYIGRAVSRFTRAGRMTGRRRRPQHPEEQPPPHPHPAPLHYILGSSGAARQLFQFLEEFHRAHITHSEPRGVSGEVMSRIPTYRFTSKNQHGTGEASSTVTTEDPEKTCTICLEPYSRGQVIATLPCSHRYHSKCIKRWLRSHNQCCVCRSVVE